MSGRGRPSGKRPEGDAGALGAYLDEAICVLDPHGTVLAALAPPEGPLALGAFLGASLLAACHPDDRASLVAGLARGELAPKRARPRLRGPSGNWNVYEVELLGDRREPTPSGTVARLRILGPAPSALASRGNRPELDLGPPAGALPLPIVLCGVDGRVYYANDAARDLLGPHCALAEQNGVASLAAPSERLALEAAVRELAEHGKRHSAVTFRVDPEGTLAEPRVVDARLSARGEGETRALVVSFVDVTAHLAREGEREARSDPLTGLANRRLVELALRDRLRRDPRRVALLYSDLDRFKAINDTYGHDVGDEILLKTAEALRETIRPGDLVARLGGDEFAVIADCERRDEARILARRIATTIALAARRGGIKVRASIGIAFGMPGDAPRDLLKRADAAMYGVKRRHRVPRSA